MAKCKYEYEMEEYPGLKYACRCPDQALRDSKEDFCIFHERSKDKDAKKFSAGIKAKMEKNDYDFTGYCFPSDIDFTRKTFEDTARFNEAEFQGDAWFDNVKFRQFALFDEAEFQGWASFKGAKFQGWAWFAEAKFQETASFRDAEFERETWFIKAKFQGLAVFYGAEFQGPAWFAGAKFQGLAPFETAVFGGTVSFEDAYFEYHSQAEVAYRKVKSSYQMEGNYAEAGYYYLLEMRARRKAKWRLQSAILRKSISFLENKSTEISLKFIQSFLNSGQRHRHLSKRYFIAKMEKYAGNVEEANQRFWQKFESALVLLSRGLERFFMDWTCAYGEKPLWVIRSAAILILGLAILYWLSGGIILRPGADIAIRKAGFLDSVYFSVVTFTTLGYGDWHPDPNHWIRYVAMTEAFTGAFMMALFILCFARKWMR